MKPEEHQIPVMSKITRTTSLDAVKCAVLGYERMSAKRGKGTMSGRYLATGRVPKLPTSTTVYCCPVNLYLAYDKGNFGCPFVRDKIAKCKITLFVVMHVTSLFLIARVLEACLCSTFFCSAIIIRVVRALRTLSQGRSYQHACTWL